MKRIYPYRYIWSYNMPYYDSNNTISLGNINPFDSVIILHSYTFILCKSNYFTINKQIITGISIIYALNMTTKNRVSSYTHTIFNYQ